MSTSTRTIKVVIDPTEAKKGAAAVNSALASIGKQADGTANSGMAKIVSSFRAANDNALKAKSGVDKLAGSMRGLQSIAVVAGAALAAAVGAALVGKAVEATKKFQNLSAQLQVATGSAQGAAAAMQRLQKFAKETPFTTEQVVKGFIKLKNLGLDPSEKAMLSYGNTAASMGKDMMQMVEAVADATTGEFERLKEFGIKTKSEGDKVKFTFAGVTTTVKNNSQEIQKYLIGLGETKFGSAMALQAKTLGGVMSSLSDTADQFLVKFGSGFAGAMASAVTGLDSGITSMDAFAEAAGRVVGGGLSALISAVGWLSDNMETLKVVAVGLIALLGTNLAIAVGTQLVAAFTAAAAATGAATLSLTTFAAVARGAVALLGGPWGIAIGAAAAGLYWLYQKSNESTSGIENLAAANGNAGAQLEQMYQESLKAVDAQDALKNSAHGAAGGLANAGGYVDALTGKMRALGIETQYTVMQLAKLALTKQIGVYKEAKANQAKAREIGGHGGSMISTQMNKEAAQAERELRALTTTLNTATKNFNEARKGVGKPAYTPPPAAGGGTTGKPKKGGGGMSDAQREAEKLKEEHEQIVENVKQYWTNLEKAATIAGMMPGEAARYNEQLAIQSAYGKEWSKLSDKEKADIQQKIAGQLELTRARELETEMKKTTLAAEQELYVRQQKVVGATQAQQEVEERIASAKLAALQKFDTLQEGITYLTSQEWKNREAALRVVLGQNAALNEQERIQQRINSAGQQAVDASIRGRKADLERGHNDRLAGLAKFLKDGKDSNGNTFTPDDYQAAQFEENNRYLEELGKLNAEQLSGLNDIAQGFGDLFGKKVGDFLQGMANIAQTLASGQNPRSGGLSSIMGGLQDLSSTLGTTFGGKTGTFFQGLSKTFGQMGMGAAVGQQIDSMVMKPLGKLFGFKTSSTGAQIGGAIGSFAGPIGTVVGSILGSVVGGLFKKTKKGKATVGFDMYGNLQVSKVSGNSKKREEQARGVAQGIVDSVNGISQALGGYINPVSGFGLTVKKKKDYTVNGKKFKKEADAIAYGIQQALNAGIIQGISEFSTRILKTANGKNLEALVQVASGYEQVLDSLAQLENPMKSSLETLIKELDKLVYGMRAAGATTAELSNVERYRQLALKEILDQELESLQDFRKSLSGEGSGITALNRLKTAQAEFKAMQADIAAGKTVDNDKFVELGATIFQLAGEVYGTSTSAFQQIRNDLIAATDGAILNVKSNFDAMVAALNTGTTAIVQQQTITNSYLGGILGALLQSVTGSSSTNYSSTNGTYTGGSSSGGYSSGSGGGGGGGYTGGYYTNLV